LLFSDYLKECRLKYALTQEDFVNLLHKHDEIFYALDTVTLSRWERAITQPNASRQAAILKVLQKEYGKYLTCIAEQNTQEESEALALRFVKYLLKDNKQLILNFPSQYLAFDTFEIVKIKNAEEYKQIINITLGLNKEFTKQLSQLNFEHFSNFAKEPQASLYICKYEEQFVGLFFTLHLKETAFKDLLSGKLKEEGISSEHFVKEGEKGSVYLLSFFAHSPKVAALLFLEFYKELLQKQDNIVEIGAASLIKDGKTFLQNLQLKHHKTMQEGKEALEFYATSLEKFLINDVTLKVLFTKR
jgi:transcriptional regulator with XRE-family HTH domain